MQETIFLRGTSLDNKEAKKILRENNVEFVEVYSELKGHQPVLYTQNSVYAYKGLAQIKAFVIAFAAGAIAAAAIASLEEKE